MLRISRDGSGYDSSRICPESGGWMGSMERIASVSYFTSAQPQRQ